MSARLPTGLLVGALLRRVNGDAQGGSVLLVLADRDGRERLVERGIGPQGKDALIDSTPADDVADYCRRRRERDPDLWVIELNSPDAERFAAETMLVD